MRTTVYVDGFNLYGGALKRAPAGYRWLNIRAVAERILQPHHQITCVHYFTAIIRPDGTNDSSPEHQKAYIKALQAYCPDIFVHYGHFLIHEARARPKDPSLGSLVEYWKVEEKGSDVNLSARFVADAFQDKFDCAVLLCNDGDMAEAVRIVREEANKSVGLLLPLHHPNRRNKRRASQHLCRNATFIREIRTKTLRQCQLPNPIPGTNLYKPSHW